MAAHQDPPSLAFSRQEHWSGLPFPSPMQKSEKCPTFLQCPTCHFSRVRLFATLWTAAVQSPLATGFSRQEYWSGLPFPSHTCICTYLYTYTCICTYTHMYMHAHAHTHMHMHTHTHIGTYTHIPLTDPELGPSLHTRPSSPPQRCPTWKS